MIFRYMFLIYILNGCREFLWDIMQINMEKRETKKNQSQTGWNHHTHIVQGGRLALPR
jgi:hypothetical protein